MDHTKLIRHHVSISLPALTSAQLAYFSLPKFPTEVRLHFWTQSAGFPTTALRFCTHFDFERTASYNGIASFLFHSPENVAAQIPTQIACGNASTRFILDLNRLVWEELQNPVPGLAVLRRSVAAKIDGMLKASLQSVQAVGEGKDILVGDYHSAEGDEPSTAGDGPSTAGDEPSTAGDKPSTEDDTV